MAKAQKNGLAQSLSGVRGVWVEDLTPTTVRRYAVEYESFLRERKGFTPAVVIGYDTSPSSKIIKSIIEDYLGCRVIGTGPCPTQAIENTVRDRKADGGIIITASHNAPEYNGFKFLRGDGALLNAKDMEELIRRVNSFDPIDDYINFAFGLVGEETLKKLGDYYGEGKDSKVIVDPNGGAACDILDDVLGRLCIDYWKLNGSFGDFGREIEPNGNTLSGLAGKLGKDDIAFGFDCDADIGWKLLLMTAQDMWRDLGML